MCCISQTLAWRSVDNSEPREAWSRLCNGINAHKGIKIVCERSGGGKNSYFPFNVLSGMKLNTQIFLSRSSRCTKHNGMVIFTARMLYRRPRYMYVVGGRGKERNKEKKRSRTKGGRWNPLGKIPRPGDLCEETLRVCFSMLPLYSKIRCRWFLHYTVFPSFFDRITWIILLQTHFFQS